MKRMKEIKERGGGAGRMKEGIRGIRAIRRQRMKRMKEIKERGGTGPMRETTRQRIKSNEIEQGKRGNRKGERKE